MDSAGTVTGSSAWDAYGTQRGAVLTGRFTEVESGRNADRPELKKALHLAKVGAKLTKLTPAQADYIGMPVAGPFKHDLYRY